VYDPTGLLDVALVEHVGAVVRDDAESPFTNPEYEAVIGATDPP